jgi:hypothetical protein
MGLTYKRLGGGASGSGSSTPYAQTFLASEWSLNGSVYELVITKAVHEKESDVQVQVYEKIGSDFKDVVVDIEVSAIGDVTLYIDSTTDLRFEGKVVIL